MSDNLPVPAQHATSGRSPPEIEAAPAIVRGGVGAIKALGGLGAVINAVKELAPYLALIYLVLQLSTTLENQTRAAQSLTDALKEIRVATTQQTSATERLSAHVEEHNRLVRDQAAKLERVLDRLPR